MADLSQPAAFGTDDGSVPAELGAVISGRARGAAGLPEFVAVLARHRVLVPLVEVGGDQLPDDVSDPCAGTDKAVAAVSVRAPDGSSLGLAFTSTSALTQWDPSARPLPVPAARAAAAVLAEGGRALLIDSGSPHAQRVEGVALARLAAAQDWPPPWEDPAVRAAVAAELAPVLATGEVQVRLAEATQELLGGCVGERVTQSAAIRGAARPAPGSAPGLAIEVRFHADLAADLVQERVAVIAHRVSRSAALREVFDGVLAVRAIE